MSDGGHAENLGAFSLLRRGCRSIVIVDATQDQDYAFQDYRKLRKAAREELGLEIVIPDLDGYLAGTSGCPNQAVFRGEVRHLPLMVDGVARSEVTELVLVKLWMNKEQASQYPLSVQKYLKEQPSAFPHQTTADQNYPARQVEAYRDLGWKIWSDYSDTRPR